MIWRDIKNSYENWGKDSSEKKIGIGCMVLTVDDWIERYESIGRDHKYTTAQIREYKLYIDLFNRLLRN